VHVKVQLSNATDIGMVEQGLLEAGAVRQCEVDGLVGTGATRSIIPADVAKRLGLSVLAEVTGTMADGSRVSCGMTSGIVFEIEGRRTLEDAYIMGDSVLIGLTVLESTDLLVDCANERVIG